LKKTSKFRKNKNSEEKSKFRKKKSNFEKKIKFRKKSKFRKKNQNFEKNYVKKSSDILPVHWLEQCQVVLIMIEFLQFSSSLFFEVHFLEQEFSHRAVSVLKKLYVKIGHIR